MIIPGTVLFQYLSLIAVLFGAVNATATTSATPSSTATTIAASTFVSPLLDPDVISSPAFINGTQFYQALNVSLPYLPTPLSNSTLTDLALTTRYAYPDFINYAIKIGGIASLDEMAMYLTQIIYQSNGLSQKVDPACENPKDDNCLALNLSANVYGTQVNYYGRGYLWIQGQSMYTQCAADLFGNDASMLMYPDVIRVNDSLNWATTAWYWNKMIKPNMSTFGSTIKLIRPSQCSGNAASPTPEATNANRIYTEILKILSPTSAASSSFC